MADEHEPQGIWALVIADMRERNRLGTATYGGPLLAHNGRDALQDAYEEALDLAVYLRQAIAEREADSADQRRSFVFGNVAISNPDVTREMVDEIADANPVSKPELKEGGTG